MAKSKGIGGHQSAVSKTHIYFTPPEIVTKLGVFDLDPCSHDQRPWDTALSHYTADGLTSPWYGRVWLNPPYDRAVIASWMKEMALHNNGISLIFNRPDNPFWHDYIFPVAHSFFHFRGRLHFYNLQGNRLPYNGGAPSVLIAYGEENSEYIYQAGFKGTHKPNGNFSILVVTFTGSWKQAIEVSLIRLNRVATVQAIYEQVEELAPGKVRQNANYKEKIRQKLQQHFAKVDRGVYTFKINISDSE